MSLNSDGSFSYTPTASYSGTDTFTFQAYDGLNFGNIATVTLNVGDSEGPQPINPGDQFSTRGDTVSLQIHAPDEDGCDPIFSATGLPPGLSIDPVTGIISGVVGSTFAEHGPYTVTVFASDSAGNTGQTSFTWTVYNFPFVAFNRDYGVATNTALSVSASAGVLAGVVDPAPEQLQAVLEQLPTHGSVVLNSDGSFTYTPNAGFTGTDTFTFNAYNGQAHSNTAVATLDIGDTTPPNVVNPGDQLATEGDVINLPIQASLPDNSVLSYSAAGLPPGLSINTDTGLISGTVQSIFTQHGPYSVSVTVSDASHTNNTSVGFTWTVGNLPATVISRSYAVAVNTPLVVNGMLGVLSGSSDPGGEDLQAVVDVTTTDGTLVVNSDGSFTYTPNADFVGADSFTFHAYDGLDSGNIATVTLHVGDTTAPVVVDPGSQLNTEGNSIFLPIQASNPSGVTSGLQRDRPAAWPEHRSNHRPHQRHSRLDIHAARTLQRHGLGERHGRKCGHGQFRVDGGQCGADGRHAHLWRGREHAADGRFDAGSSQRIERSRR